jgi:hypothetical protein
MKIGLETTINFNEESNMTVMKLVKSLARQLASEDFNQQESMK